MNLSKELKKRRDAEERLKRTSPTKTYIEGTGYLDLSMFATKTELANGLLGKAESNHSHNFLDLNDTPDAYVANKLLVINSAGDAIILADVPAAANGIPAGGTTDQLLAKNSNNDYDGKWVNAPSAANGIPGGGTGGQILSKIDGTDYNAQWIANKKSIAFYIDDVLEAGTNLISVIIPQALKITGIKLAVDIAPTGANLIIDINQNGTSIYTTQVNRPTITAGNTTADAILPDTINLVTGDKISLDIDQIGSTIAGENLAIIVICEVA